MRWLGEEEVDNELAFPSFKSLIHEEAAEEDWYFNHNSSSSSLNPFDFGPDPLAFCPDPINLGPNPIGSDHGFTLRPLEASSPPVGTQPTLFQKRAAAAAAHLKQSDEDGSVGGSGMNYDSAMENVKGKKKTKGMPAKNLMAERRRRKKLNDRLYMLRSVVPRISKV